jgi:signal transduction histidine kinase
VHVKYSNRPAIMIVIRNISVIVEFEQVKSENKYQELLTATMSHEMLTPLNSIINLAVYLEEKIKVNLQQREHSEQPSRGVMCKNDIFESIQCQEYVHIIKSSANMLQYLIKDLIDLMNVKLDRFIIVC